MRQVLTPLLLHLFIILSPGSLLGQSSARIDSLYSLLKTAGMDTGRVKILFKLREVPGRNSRFDLGPNSGTSVMTYRSFVR